MNENRFDQILDFLCSGIMSKRERENVKDELYDHLMSKYEINLAVGMNEEKAADEAVNALGNRYNLRENLSKVHSYYPALSLKKAMTLLIVGYLFMSIHINFFDGMQQITTFLGEIVFLVGMFCFRTANKKLRCAFTAKVSVTAISAITYGFSPLLGSIPALNIIFNVAEMLLNALSWYWLYQGLKILTEPYKEQSSKPLRFGLCTLVSCVPIIVGGIIALLTTGGEQTTVNFTSDDLGVLIIPFFAIIILAIILPVQLFSRINKLLYASDHEYKVADSSVQKFGVACVAVALCLLLTFAGDFAYVNQKAETSPYTVNDIELSDDEYSAICDGLRSYNIPDDVILKLPKSEIANYKGIVNSEELSEKYELIMDMRGSDYEGYTEYYGSSITHYLAITDDYYAVMISDEKGERIRILSHFRYERNNRSSVEPEYYVDGICMYLNNSEEILPTFVDDYEYESENYRYNGDFLLILSEENGELLKNEPLRIYDKESLNVFPYRGIAGYEYEAKLGMDVFFASSYYVPNEESCSTSKDIKLIHRRHPLSFGARTVGELMDFGETIHFYNFYSFEEFHISNSLWWKDYEKIEENAEVYDETSDVYADEYTEELEPTGIFDENYEYITY